MNAGTRILNRRQPWRCRCTACHLWPPACVPILTRRALLISSQTIIRAVKLLTHHRTYNAATTAHASSPAVYVLTPRQGLGWPSFGASLSSIAARARADAGSARATGAALDLDAPACGAPSSRAPSPRGTACCAPAIAQSLVECYDCSTRSKAVANAAVAAVAGCCDRIRSRGGSARAARGAAANMRPSVLACCAPCSRSTAFAHARYVCIKVTHARVRCAEHDETPSTHHTKRAAYAGRTQYYARERREKYAYTSLPPALPL